IERTTTGWMMPRSLIDAARSSSSASEKLRRGFRGLGRTSSIVTRRGFRARSGVAVSVPTSPISAARPRPSRDRPSSGIAISPDLFSSRCATLLVGIDRAILLRWARDQFLLALDDFRGEAQIGFAADAFEIV